MILNSDSFWSNVATYKKTALKKFHDVNSFHRYGAYNTNGNLNITAKSSDGVIMALEHNKLNIYGIMWHPERENPFSINDINMIRFKILLYNGSK